MSMIDSRNKIDHERPAATGVSGDEMLVDVGGRRLYMTCMGEGTPTVILEHGMATESDSWAQVQPGCCQVRPGVCVRPGRQREERSRSYAPHERGYGGRPPYPSGECASTPDLTSLVGNSLRRLQCAPVYS